MSQGIIYFNQKPSVLGGSAVCGGLERSGPLSGSFDLSDPDSKFGAKTWEKAESEMVRICLNALFQKTNTDETVIDSVYSGDLTNQCTATTLGICGYRMPVLGLYGACSTFALALGLSAATVNAGFGEKAVAITSSHFCTAERQYRYPLEYGSQRTPTAQTTVTGCGAALLGNHTPSLPYVSEFLPGIICDRDIHDTTHMGAAMAPACADTLVRYFSASGNDPDAFDMILTGDLGVFGHELLRELCEKQGFKLGNNLFDCGLMIYDRERQKVDAGGSGCGCSSAVFCGSILQSFAQDRLHDVLLIGTGALLSSTSVLQGESIPGIAHLVRIQKG